jgi:hypothetical protein
MTVNHKLTTILSIIVVIASILLGLARPDLWALALGFAVFTITLISIAYNAGLRQGHEIRTIAEAVIPNVDMPEQKTEAEIRLEMFDESLAEVQLFAYELEQGLVPDGDTDTNPGYGPMDFDEWRLWKQREFERTGNLWHNHPNGLPPQLKDKT